MSKEKSQISAQCDKRVMLVDIWFQDSPTVLNLGNADDDVLHLAQQTFAEKRYDHKSYYWKVLKSSEATV